MEVKFYFIISLFLQAILYIDDVLPDSDYLECNYRVIIELERKVL